MSQLRLHLRLELYFISLLVVFFEDLLLHLHCMIPYPPTHTLPNTFDDNIWFIAQNSSLLTLRYF